MDCLGFGEFLLYQERLMVLKGTYVHTYQGIPFEQFIYLFIFLENEHQNLNKLLITTLKTSNITKFQ